MKRILIVEDESSISDFVKGELEYEGYEVCIKEDGREGLEEALNNEYDLVILDIMLPSMNGFEICRRIKRVKATPVIMLSAKSSVIDKVNGLKLGADDYSIFKFKDITIDTKSRIVKRNNEEINLTNKEYELLMILIENKDEVVTRDELLERIWGYDTETNVTDVYIRYLRSKLNNENKEEYIQTVRSIGYIMRS